MSTPAQYDLTGKRVFVAGHAGMVGSALLRRLQYEHCEVLTAPRSELDLRRQSDVDAWFAAKRPHVVIQAAAKVGGILANSTLPADFIYDNLMINANTAAAALRTGCEKYVGLGSSCIYPKLAPQPIQESALLTGPLEPTNEWYAIAKIASIKLLQSYRQQFGFHGISLQPTNLYGPNDNYDLNSSHVLPAMIRKAHEAKERNDGSMVVWGTGAPMREFLYVDDLADAIVFLTRRYDGAEPVNVGSGQEVSIKDLAHLVCRIVGFKGNLMFDASKPDGTPRKYLDNRRIESLGWRPKTRLEEGIALAYRDFLTNGKRR